MLNKKTEGIYLALITALISGISIFANKYAVGAIKPPLVFTAVKNSYVGLMILGLILMSGKWRKLKNLTTKEAVYLLLIGVIGGSIPFYLFFTGTAQIPAINSAMIHKTLVIWVAIMAVPFLKEKFSIGKLLAIGALFASNYVIGGFKGLQFSTGELLVLAATLFWAVENVIAKKVLSTVDSDLVTGARMILGSLILLVAAFIVHPKSLAGIFSLTSVQWFWMIFTAFLLLSYVMSWYKALSKAPAVTVTAILVASTLVTNVLSAIFVTHAWTREMTLQAGLIIVGISVFKLIWTKEVEEKVRIENTVSDTAL